MESVRNEETDFGNRPKNKNLNSESREAERAIG